MPNRAKCKLCNDIIESKHVHDYVTCKCGEISVDGGNDYFHANVKSNIENFLCVDDEGNEIIPKHKPQDEQDIVNSSQPMKLDKNELLKMLDEMARKIEELPVNALMAPVTHSDHYSLIILLSSILRA